MGMPSGKFGVSLAGLTEISDAGAKMFGSFRGALCLDGLTSLSDSAAAHLSRHRGDLSLNLLENLSEAAALHLGRHSGALSLHGIKVAADEVLRNLAMHDGPLLLNGLRQVSDAAADCFSRHEGELHLNGVRSLTDAAAASLSQHSGPLFLKRVSRISYASYMRLASCNEVVLKRRRFSIGRISSQGLAFTGPDLDALSTQGLPVLVLPDDIAKSFGITVSQLKWLCYDSGGASTHYISFQIPKRDGSLRTISAPKPLLRRVQATIKAALLDKVPPNADVAMAFRKGRSIVDNASIHAGRPLVLRVDIQDFFPSITHRRVKGLFQSFGYSPGIALLLAVLCTEPAGDRSLGDNSGKSAIQFERVVPQGAATSPDIANLVCRSLDRRVSGLARKLGFTFTRYADDLVFSHASAGGEVGVLLAALREILASEGFRINEKKTCVMRNHKRQVVTGLVVNSGKPRVSRRDARRFRAIAHHCRTKGYEAVSNRLGKDARSFLHGYLSYVKMVNPDQAAALAKGCPDNILAVMKRCQRLGGVVNRFSPPGGLSFDGEHLRNSIGMRFVQIQAGSFLRQRGDCELIAEKRESLEYLKAGLSSTGRPLRGWGYGLSPNWQKDQIDQLTAEIEDLQTQWKVNVGRPYLIGAVPVTEEDYVAVTKDGTREQSRRPVINVTWHDVQVFCRLLSLVPAEQAAGRFYRLPTEAEWEFACSLLPTAADRACDSSVDDIAWHEGNSSGVIHPVMQKRPNGVGLYDLLGNAWEWCEDWYGELPGQDLTDPVGPESGEYRVLRGGSWRSPVEHCTPAKRNAASPSLARNDIGFRVVLVLDDLQ